MEAENSKLYHDMELLDRVALMKRLLDDGVLVQKETLSELVYDLADEVKYLKAQKTNMKAKETVETQGVKYDSDKPDLSLLSPIAITYLAAVLSFGAKKYDSHNWRKGIDKARLVSAAMRHLLAALAGEQNDRETGLPHSAHVMCNMMFLCELETAENPIDSTFVLTSYQQDLLALLLANIGSGK